MKKLSKILMVYLHDTKEPSCYGLIHSQHLALAVFHWCAPFGGYQYDLDTRAFKLITFTLYQDVPLVGLTSVATGTRLS